MTITLDKPTLDELRERAIALGVEAEKALRAGATLAPVLDLAIGAREEAQRVGGDGFDFRREITVGYIAYLTATLQPGFQETLAEDGDLLHPKNALGEKLDLSRVAE